jgi:hypothetical protein
MSNHNFHSEHYKVIREELNARLAQIWKIEIFATGGIFPLYAWLVARRNEPIPSLVWYLGVPLVVIGGFRCLAHQMRIHEIAKYLAKIEKELFGQNTSLPGYERHFKASVRIRVEEFVTLALWLLLLVVSLVAPIIVGHRRSLESRPPVRLMEHNPQ